MQTYWKEIQPFLETETNLLNMNYSQENYYYQALTFSTCTFTHQRPKTVRQMGIITSISQIKETK